MFTGCIKTINSPACKQLPVYTAYFKIRGIKYQSAAITAQVAQQLPLENECAGWHNLEPSGCRGGG